MNDGPLEGSPVRGDDVDLVTALRAARLPTDDLTDEGRRFFRFHRDGGNEPLGHGGWEWLGGGAILLRSLVVTPAHRGRGVGRGMVGWLLSAAGSEGATVAHLMTTDAAQWFERLGFIVTPRDQASPELRACRQFATLCPSSATVMSFKMENTQFKFL